MELLRDVVAKLQSFQEAENTELETEKSQEGSDLFLEANHSSAVEAKKEQVGGNKFKYSFNYPVSCITDSHMTPFVFRSLLQFWAPSSSIHVWSSGFWRWRCLRRLLTL